ncbi:MAG: methionine--tRNA ligase, partial [Candidatus Bathyarchaeota archaeon]|nr:methionine--tRNA ligase [Candidatus Bathyarchaeota archaeon]
MNKSFITTAIDYVNAPPHVGHALEKIQADVIARYYRLLLGDDKVWFLTGTDENSLKNVKAAKKEGIPVQKLVDRNSEKFYKLKEALNLSFNDFIRTTEERHIKGVQKLWLACKEKGDIDNDKKKYKGFYCVGCEEFYKESELKNGLCPEHETKPELIEEENYFFRLSKYQYQLEKIIQEDEIKIIPETRKNEVLSFIKAGLKDICISRSAERAQGWGINVPGDDSQKIWVWFDALSSYINAVDYANEGTKFRKWWSKETEIVHIIGKGILRFHAVYWPAFLLSAGLPLPKTIFVHGYLGIEGKKISKSLGNVVDPFELIKKYKADVVRYFLLREIPTTEDGDFNFKRLEERKKTDLADGPGNLLRRTLTMAEKHWEGKIPKIDINNTGLKKFSLPNGQPVGPSRFNRSGSESFNFRENIEEKHKSISYFFEKTLELNKALLSTVSLI